jgi:hypothetical protein
MKTETRATKSSPILIDQITLNDTTKWYNQQIDLAKKRVQLSELNAQIAENTFKETLAYAKIAQLSAGEPKGSDKTNQTNTEVNSEVHATISSEVTEEAV